MLGKIFKGVITESDYGEYWAAIFVGGSEEPFAKQFDEMFSGKRVSVRYWISDTEKEIDELKINQLLKIVGSVEADYSDAYSDITGYLWTDQMAKVGGHDLLNELQTNIGKFLYMEVSYE